MEHQAKLWDDDEVVQTLRELRSREHIPESNRRAEIRARLVSAADSVRLYAIETRLGWMGVARTGRGVRYLQLPRRTASLALRDLQREFPDAAVGEEAPEELKRELREYAEGRRRSFSIPLDLEVRPFQRAVLLAIARIPFGETRTYGWVAREIGQPKAARAVGQALHTNPIPIILPCHRVIASDGRLGGYGGGLPLKQTLLALEGVMNP